MNLISGKNFQPDSSFQIAIVCSRFNQPVTEELKSGTINRLIELGINEKNLTIIEVPGAIEIPLIVKQLAQKRKYQVIIALGAVIRGETSHYDYVCSQVSEGCQAVMMDFNIPVIFGVLTTENSAQAWDRLGGNHGHKGIECADCAIEMIHLVDQIKSK